MEKLLLLALAGAMGSLARYGLSSLIGGAAFPLGIFCVNVLGCFLFGAVWTAAGQYHLFSDSARMIILTGFMGAFTTFSTFIFDTLALAGEERWMALILNLAGQIGLGLLALAGGMRLAQLVIGAASQ